MADDRFDESTEVLHWMQAARFMDVHGERWPDEAFASLRAVDAVDKQKSKHWLELIDKMTMIAEAPRH
ncbi:hypothetical protein U1872_18170 [Sphingomonas sp. RB3P16]|uniref:hypothetical protein n=1 Tax=Parasphingomonas frigoris TaxID=3096163 RepID=UPI002FC87327